MAYFFFKYQGQGCGEGFNTDRKCVEPVSFRITLCILVDDYESAKYMEILRVFVEEQTMRVPYSTRQQTLVYLLLCH